MLTFTFGEILDGVEGLVRRLYVERYCIYICRNGQEVLYVGQSGSPCYRLYKHFGSRSDELGQAVRQGLPGSREWPVDFLAVGECKEMVAEYCCTVNPPAYLSDVDLLERALIYHHQPPCNNAHKELSEAVGKLVRVRRLILDALAASSPDYPAILYQIAKELNIRLYPTD